MNHPIQMYEYHAWATQTLLKRIKELPDSLLREEVNTSFTTVGEAFAHIYSVDSCWLQILGGTPMPQALEASFPLQPAMLGYSADEFADAFGEQAKQYREWYRSQDDLEISFLLDNPYVGPRATRRSEILLHVANHGTYHRGNISTMLRQLGHASIMTDYVLSWYVNPEHSS